MKIREGYLKPGVVRLLESFTDLIESKKHVIASGESGIEDMLEDGLKMNQGSYDTWGNERPRK